MKKIVLLFAVLCTVGVLGAMEPKNQPVVWGEEWKTLPHEIKILIIMALTQSGDDLDSAIKNIVKASRINQELNKMINLNDLKGFTKIAHMLADKFNMTPREVARMFQTPTATRYVDLYNQLIEAVADGNVIDAKRYIDEGVDMDAGLPLDSILRVALLRWSSGLSAIPIIKLLLAHGANPNAKFEDRYAELTALEYIDHYYFKAPEYEQVKLLLEEAMKK